MICHTFLLVLSVLEGCCRVAENYFSILKIFLFPISPHQRFKLSYLSKREASTTTVKSRYEVILNLLSYLSKRKASTTLSYSMLYNSIELSHKMYLIHFQRLNSISTYFRKYIFFIISNNTFFNSTKFTTSCISTN